MFLQIISSRRLSVSTLLVFSIASFCTCQSQGKPTGNESSTTDQMSFRRTTQQLDHSVLKIKSLQLFDKSQIDSIDLRKLCDMDSEGFYLAEWEEAFAKSEYDAARALADKFIRQPKSVIKKRLGSPRFRSEIPAFMENPKNASEQWDYFVGGTKVPLIFMFSC